MENSHDFMIHRVRCNMRGWTIPGPPQTNVKDMTLYQMPGGRLAFVQNFFGGGFDVFVQSEKNNIDECVAELTAMTVAADLVDALEDLLEEVENTAAFEDAMAGEDKMMMAAVDKAQAALIKAGSQVNGTLTEDNGG